MCVLIPVDVADFLCGAGHFTVAAQIIEEHEAAVKINAFQDKISHHNLQQGGGILVLLEFIVAISDERIPAQQMLVILPLVKDGIALGRAADGVQHIAVALTVHTFLEGLDGQAQIHLIRSDVFPYVRQVGSLDGIQENQEA